MLFSGLGGNIWLLIYRAIKVHLPYNNKNVLRITDSKTGLKGRSSPIESKYIITIQTLFDTLVFINVSVAYCLVPHLVNYKHMNYLLAV